MHAMPPFKSKHRYLCMQYGVMYITNMEIFDMYM